MKTQMMRSLFTIITVFLAFTVSVSAQDWLTDFNRAKEVASEKRLPIILVFQGSDWCAPCIKLDREIWSSDYFKEYAPGKYVMLKADFPRRKQNALSEEQTKANAMLAEKYNRNGIFPFVVVLNEKGEVLGETGYKKCSPEEYIEELNSLVKSD